MNHDAHIQAALTAACQFGRAQYDARMRLENYDCSRAITALNAMYGHKPVIGCGNSVAGAVSSPVIGGGNSITGKINWLLENRGAMTRDEMATAMGADVNSVTNIVASLRNKKVLSVEGVGNAAKFSLRKQVCDICGDNCQGHPICDHRRHHVGKMASVFLALCLCASVVQAAQVTLGTQMATPVASPLFAPSLSVVAPPTPKTNLFYNIGLAWDASNSPLTTGYRLRYGTNTVSGMTNLLTTTNTFCTVSNLALRPTWYFQAATLYGTNQSEWSFAIQVQPPLEQVFTLSTVFPLYASSNAVNWVTNKIVTLVVTNPPGMTFFRSHLKQLEYSWTNNQLLLKPFQIP